MAKRLEMSIYKDILQFITVPGTFYRVEGSFDFGIFYELINPLQNDEIVTKNIVGFEIQDITSVEEADIPDIDEKYDVDDTGFKEMTIKQIVMAVKQEYLKEKNKNAA